MRASSSESESSESEEEGSDRSSESLDKTGDNGALPLELRADIDQLVSGLEQVSVDGKDKK
jgi:hypothetical protein